MCRCFVQFINGEPLPPPRCKVRYYHANRNVFSRRLKAASVEFTLQTGSGRLFHADGNTLHTDAILWYACIRRACPKVFYIITARMNPNGISTFCCFILRELFGLTILRQITEITRVCVCVWAVHMPCCNAALSQINNWKGRTMHAHAFVLSYYCFFFSLN